MSDREVDLPLSRMKKWRRHLLGRTLSSPQQNSLFNDLKHQTLGEHLKHERGNWIFVFQVIPPETPLWKVASVMAQDLSHVTDDLLKIRVMHMILSVRELLHHAQVR
ncbi:unnamed protein product [Darwinula stevensoni]|uniref:Uncharacterized protein n=1 Tax=Darwinula stevensoni TaxID=69355 RepID=A0A7R8ZYI2_9CRUS|nr:unnamed protein product [Darwinula stevensoni]CAG0880562.1 unnamed protein product [Darwinula stevensoni]